MDILKNHKWHDDEYVTKVKVSKDSIKIYMEPIDYIKFNRADVEVMAKVFGFGPLSLVGGKAE